MHLYLTGFMASGKTTVGQILARRLDRPFVDLDAAIEGRAGMPVRAIFEQGGESLFRQLEHEALREVSGGSRMVVATGGGTVTIERNLDVLARSGITVWLDPPFVVIASRIGAEGKSDRPLFESETQALALYRRRLPAYRKADIRVGVSAGERPEEVAARVELLVSRECR